jgi:hypothetical protein
MMNVCYVFKGAGGHIAWYLGYAKYLQDHTDLSNATFAGTSAGGIIATFLAAGIPIYDVWRQWFSRTIRDLPPGFRFPNKEFAPIAKKHARSLLSPEAFDRIKGRLHISLTDIHLERTSVSEFNSIDDLIECVMTSCHVPWIIDCNATNKYRDKRYMDGSIAITLNGLNYSETYTPCGDKINHVHIKTPYRWYEQLASLVRFDNMGFHFQNYIDGYKYAKEQAQIKTATQTEPINPISHHFDQSTVSL